ncbi:hypothetical protein EAE96_003593 [Botrytis aclada]|nr:hypothetical protein EAE96_003593 [Botrytis aclada]
MAAKSESDFATRLSTPLLGTNDNDGTAISPPENLGTSGFVSSIGVPPSTPRLNPKNNFTLTPEHTPPPSSSSPLSRSSANITSESNQFISGFGTSSATIYTPSHDSVASLPRWTNGSYFRPDFTFRSPPTALNDPATPSTDITSEKVHTSFDNLSLSDPFISTPPPITFPSKLDTCPSTPILPRDRYDLNSPRTPFHHELNLKSEDLRTNYQNLQFCRKWTSHLISHLTGIPLTHNLTSTFSDSFITTTSPSRTHSLIEDNDLEPFPPRADYPNELTILTRRRNLLRENDLAIAKSMLEALTTHLLSLPLRPTLQNKNANTDTLLYRVHTPTSKSTYSRSYGFRCSGWTDSLYTSGVADERQRDGRAFQGHCNSKKVPSPYISVSTSVARIMRLRECKGENEAGSRVSVISLNRLTQLGIKAQSTDLYIQEFVNSSGNQIYIKDWNGDEENPDGVAYVTDTHWLVEEWIPDQAIVSEMDCEEFLKIAKREGINKVDARGWPFDTKLETLKVDLEKWPKRDGSEQEEKIIKPKYSRRRIVQKKVQVALAAAKSEA